MAAIRQFGVLFLSIFFLNLAFFPKEIHFQSVPVPVPVLYSHPSCDLEVGLGILQITSPKQCPQVWPWFGRSLFSTNFVEFDQAV